MALAHTFEANPHWLPRNPRGALDALPGRLIRGFRDAPV